MFMIKRITLTDNTPNQKIGDLNGVEDELLYLSSQTIDKLKDGMGKNILIFPHSFRKLDILPQRIFTVDSMLVDGKVIANSISTSNMMGFLGINNVEISITSRFTNDDKSDYFLQYILKKVMNVNLFNLKYGFNKESVFDLLPFLFPFFFKNAMRQGFFRRYCRHSYNDMKLKGTIDVSRQLQKNIPFNYRIAYSVREFDADNILMQLIRHTIEYIQRKEYGNTILHNDRETDSLVMDIIRLTPSYDIRQRKQIIKANSRRFYHPYFTEYAKLQKLCLHILGKCYSSYDGSKDIIYGILFDGAWLWEEYLATIFKNIGYKHPQNKKHSGGIYLAKDNKYIRFPDFYKEDIVLDAKYKNDIDKRNDINQILTYMYRLKAKTSAFILPQKTGELDKTELEKDLEFMGYGGFLSFIRMNIPLQLQMDYETFENEMLKEEENLINKIKNLSNKCRLNFS